MADPEIRAQAHSTKGYLLGTDAGEVRRLEAQHRIWSGTACALWDRAGFSDGDHLIDLGCGPGFAAIDLARRVGEAGTVTAVDESAEMIERLTIRARKVGLNQLKARVERVESLDLEPNSLEGAFARWLFCFLPDPEPVIDSVAAALRPGGRALIWDYVNYAGMSLQPRSKPFDRAAAAMQEYMRRPGGSLDIGGVLPGLLVNAGLRIVELVPIVHYARAGSAHWSWLQEFLFGRLPELVRLGLISEADLVRFRDDWRDRARDPGTFLCTPPMIGIIAEAL